MDHISNPYLTDGIIFFRMLTSGIVKGLFCKVVYIFNLYQ